jgi:type VI secretion system secreted protein Hcp
MGIGSRFGRPGKVALAVAAAAAGGGAALAVASVPDSTGEIHACVEELNGTPLTNAGNLRIIDPSANPAQTCVTNVAGGPSEVPISWNTVGLRGPAGSPGATGAQGPPGNVITIAGQTFTLSNGRTATVTREPTIAPLPVKPGGKPVGALSLNLGSAGPSTIEVLSWSFGASQSSSVSGRGGGTGKVSFHTLQITKRVDKSSPSLFKACATGKHIKTAILTLRKAGGTQPLTIKLSNVLISSYQQSNAVEKPTESLSLNFTKIEYKSQVLTQ